MTTTDMEQYTLGTRYRVRIDPAATLPTAQQGREHHIAVRVNPSTEQWVLVLPRVPAARHEDDGWQPHAFLSDREFEAANQGEDWLGWFVTAEYVTVLGPEADFSAETGWLTSRVAELTEELERERAQRSIEAARLTEQARRAEVDLASFKALVRSTAIDRAEQHDWCSVIDDILDDLGLERRVRLFDVECEVTMRVVVQVEASTEDDAEAAVNDAELLQNWRITSPFESFGLNSNYPSDVEVDVKDVGEA